MNFLKYKVQSVYSDGEKKLRCLVSKKMKQKSPEEIVRQSVLKWLINEKQIAPECIEIEAKINFVRQNHGKADIVIYNNPQKMGQPALLVECKQQKYKLDFNTREQAISYARVLNPSEVLITNGSDSIVLSKKNGNWLETDVLSIDKRLKLSGQLPFLQSNNFNKKTITQYLIKNTEFSSWDEKAWGSLKKEEEYQLYKFAMFLYSKEPLFDLPFSFKGVHVLEDHGIGQVKFSNASGKPVHSLCRLLLIAIRGKVEMLSVALTTFHQKIYLNVGFIKESRTHNAIEIQLKKYSKYNEKENTTIYYHNGVMSREKSHMAINAMKEVGRDDLIDVIKKREVVVFGKVSNGNKYDLSGLRTFFANLFHYSLVRSELRDYLAVKKKKTAK